MKRPLLSIAFTYVVLPGVVGGVLIALLRWSEYQFLVLEHSFAIYGALVAVLFAGLGLWFGARLSSVRTKHGKPEPAERAAASGKPPAVFLVNQHRVGEVGITPRELEILGLVAEGLSNREIASRIFVSENTVKTHCSRAFDKLGARRRTQAVQRGKELGLIP